MHFAFQHILNEPIFTMTQSLNLPILTNSFLYTPCKGGPILREGTESASKKGPGVDIIC